MKLDDLYRIDPCPEPTIRRGSTVYMSIPSKELDLYVNQGWMPVYELTVISHIVIAKRKESS